VSRSDWLEQSESLTCGSRSTVSVDRSTINVDRAVTRPQWAWAGPDLGRAGPPRGKRWRCHVAWMDSNWVWVLVDMAHGGLTAMVYGFTRSPWWTLFTLLFSPLVHGAPGVRNSASAPSLFLLFMAAIHQRWNGCSHATRAQ
jgi:hypothetical protein